MADKELATAFLGDDSFEFVTQKTGWTKAYYRTIDTTNPSDIPVYTAALEPVAYVSKQSAKPIEASEVNPVLSFGANGDGSAGTNFVYHVRPFYVSNDRTCVRVKNKNIHPRFVYYKLQDIKKIYGFDFHYKATPNNVSLISIEIPKNAKGQFNLKAQQVAIEQFTKHEQMRKTVADHRERISTALVALEMPFPFEEESIDNSELFELNIGRRVLKKDVVKAGVPVYSANVRKPFGFTRQTILKDFTRPSLLWGIDGNFDWNLLPKDMPFMPTDHCGILRIKSPLIHAPYIYHVLQATRERYGFDRTFRASLMNIKTVTLPIPIKDGKYDLDAQIIMAKKYEKIEKAKQTAVATLDRIVDAIVPL